MDFIDLVELVGTVAFAVSGAVCAIEKKLDWYGICFLAIVTAIGGGIIRDVLLDLYYPASLVNPKNTMVSIATAVLVIVFYNQIKELDHLVSIADGIGLAAFAAIGSQAAVLQGHNEWFSVITMAVMTGTFGGVLRDVLVREVPRCFHREVYASAAIIGAISYKVTCDFSGSWNATYVCFVVTLAIRMISMEMGWELGRVELVGNRKKQKDPTVIYRLLKNRNVHYRWRNGDDTAVPRGDSGEERLDD